MHTRLSRAAAVLAIAALTACGGGGLGGPSAPSTPGPQPINPPAGGSILVGVGDSLTAGYQSSGFLGQGLIGGTAQVTSPLSNYPQNAVYPGQESGFWAVMYQQMTGVQGSETAVMPLIAGPGLGNQLVLNNQAFLIGSHLQGGCDAFNQASYGASTWQQTRLNPSATILDLGVPGITMHEAVAMTGPLTGPPPGPVKVPVSATNPTGYACPGYAASTSDPTAGNLQTLVTGESQMFYPVLGQYQANLGANLTELNAAVALKPKLATVWLGANDLLKYTFSGGNPIASDSTAQMSADLTQIVTALTQTGSKVLVGDLPNILNTPQFFPQSRFVGDCATLAVLFSKGAITPPPAGTAVPVCTGISAALAANKSVQYTAGAYLTETGFFDAVAQGVAAVAANPAAPNFAGISLDHNGPGSGLGAEYLTVQLAGQVQALNTGYNAAIDKVATSSGSSVALVPITQIFNALAYNGTSWPNLSALIPGAPSATLQFGGGLVSWDGLHPSYLGYSVIAYEFIAMADAPASAGGLGLAIPQVSAAQLGGAAGIDPYSPALVNPGFPFPVFPLP